VVTALRGSDVLARFRLVGMDLPCMSFGTAVSGGAVACIAREVSAHLLESKSLAAAVVPAAAPAAAAGQQRTGKLAVLELRNFTSELTRENAQYFTDLVRSGVLKARPKLEVITRENLLVLLQASGKDLSNCEGECEVDTG